MAVPPLIDRETFDAVQARLKSRQPMVTPSRVSSGPTLLNQAVGVDMIRTFANTARERLRLENGGYRRDHLRALAQRVEVADKEVRIMGTKSELLRTLVAASSGKSALLAFAVLY